jgi:serine/threonine protein phosphatase 1
MVLDRLFSSRKKTPPAADTPRRVPAGTLAYAVGDIHGRADLLERLQAQIGADAAGRDAQRRLVVYLGDYVDRGPASAGVIDRLLTAPLEGFEAMHLLGNHERLLLDFLDDAAVGPFWFRNGGIPTMASYGVSVPERIENSDQLETLRAQLAERLPRAHRAFLEGLQLMADCGDYCFVHAGVRPGVALAEQKEEDLLWIRGLFLETEAEYGKLIVHGHTIRAEPEFRPWRIGIDTGAFSSGRLTALVLDGDRQDLIQTAA